MFIKKIYHAVREKLILSGYKKRKNSVILMFHSVLFNAEEKKSYYVDESAFRNFINKYKNHIKSMEEVLANPQNKCVSISFDDVRNDVYTNAVPILAETKTPFVLFVNTSLLDTNGYISTKQLVELSKNNLATIGSHCMTHKPLKKQKYDSQANEIINSKKTLEKIINKKVNYIAYPYGQYNRTTIKLSSKNYSYGFVSYGGLINDKKIKKRLTIPRQNVDDSNFESVQQLIDKFVINK